MSDSDFVDVGDELVVRIAGFPVGKARVQKIEDSVFVCLDNGDTEVYFSLPLDFKDFDVVDGVSHTEIPECPCPYDCSGCHAECCP